MTKEGDIDQNRYLSPQVSQAQIESFKNFSEVVTQAVQSKMINEEEDR